jgi:hypothetical protein
MNLEEQKDALRGRYKGGSKMVATLQETVHVLKARLRWAQEQVAAERMELEKRELEIRQEYAQSEAQEAAKKPRETGGFLGEARIRGARVANPGARQQTRRNGMVRQILQKALKAIERVVGGVDVTGDATAPLRAVAQALQVASGRRSLVVDPSLLVPERTRLKLAKETRKSMLATIYDPEGWIQLYDENNITFKSGRAFGAILPFHAKPNDNKLLEAKKYIDEIMDEINPISPTPGGNGHMVSLHSKSFAEASNVRPELSY